tara:strand:+ start:1279 stop:1527 length:249 start_codon:yes stop_codon:yes gene_type:complete
MLVENLKIDIFHKWNEVVKVKKSKNNPTGKKLIEHSDQKVGSINIDWAMDMEAVEKLVDAIQENVFEHDGVKLDVNFNTDNW